MYDILWWRQVLLKTPKLDLGVRYTKKLVRGLVRGVVRGLVRGFRLSFWCTDRCVDWCVDWCVDFRCFFGARTGAWIGARKISSVFFLVRGLVHGPAWCFYCRICKQHMVRKYQCCRRTEARENWSCRKSSELVGSRRNLSELVGTCRNSSELVGIWDDDKCLPPCMLKTRQGTLDPTCSDKFRRVPTNHDQPL